MQSIQEPTAMLSESDLMQFNEDGYIILPKFLPPAYCEALKTDLDNLTAKRAANEKPVVIAEPYIGDLITYEPIMSTLDQLFQSKYSMHHTHAIRQNAGTPGVSWHQDYEQIPQTNRTKLMVHIFYYLNGLNGTIGDLMVVPGTHKKILPNNLHFLGNADLPNQRTFDSLEPGSAVIVHSALMHARKPKPGGENKPRYFIDISYCQAGGKWPGYCGFHHFKKNNEYALKNGLDKNGTYKHIFDSETFFEYPSQTDFDKLQGSLLDGRKTI